MMFVGTLRWSTTVIAMESLRMLSGIPVLHRQMDRRILFEILVMWFSFWLPGACLSSLLMGDVKKSAGFFKRLYVMNAMSLCFLCSIPAWIVGLPPWDSWKYDLGMIVLLAIGVVLGFISAGFVLERPGWKSYLLATGHCTFAVLLFCLPLALTFHESYAVFDSSVVVPSVAIQDCSSSGIYKFAQLSDLHVVANGTRTRDNSRSGILELPQIVDTVHSMHPQFVFITGDMTDGGEEAEWSSVSVSLQRLSATSLIVMSPGNHDMNLIFDLNDETKSHISSDAKRIQRFFTVQSKLNLRVRTFDGEALPKILDEAPPEPSETDFQRDQARLSDCYWSCGSMDPDFKSTNALCRVSCAKEAREFPSFKSIELIDRYWQKVASGSFPLVETEGSTVVIVLGTVFTAPSVVVGQNALGGLTLTQLGQFDEILQAIPQQTKEIYILAHHPFTRPADEKLTIPQTLSIVEWQNSRLFAYSLLRYDAAQARKVIDLIDRTATALPATKIFVLFGHRHMRSFAQRENISFLESPNLATDEPGWHGLFAKTELNSFPCWYRTK
jgi:hypothetical protein